MVSNTTCQYIARVCVCVCVYIYIYIYIHKHTHTHIARFLHDIQHYLCVKYMHALTCMREVVVVWWWWCDVLHGGGGGVMCCMVSNTACMLNTRALSALNASCMCVCMYVCMYVCSKIKLRLFASILKPYPC